MSLDNFTTPQLEAEVKRRKDEVMAALLEDRKRNGWIGCQRCNGIGLLQSDPFDNATPTTACWFCNGYGIVDAGVVQK